MDIQIASPFHVLCAVYKAVNASEQGQMKTRNIFSEIIFSLSPSTNVSVGVSSGEVCFTQLTYFVATQAQCCQQRWLPYTTSACTCVYVCLRHLFLIDRLVIHSKSLELKNSSKSVLLVALHTTEQDPQVHC